MARRSILTPFQSKVFNEIVSNQYFQKKYYFGGGTALAEFYLYHRYSKDLDFFTKKEISHQQILKILKPKFNKMGIDSFEYREQAGMKIFFFQNHGGQKLKVDFNYFPFPRLKKGKKYQEFEIDSLFDLTLNKLSLILTRTKARDYVDFYFIQKKKNYSWEEIFQGIKRKYSWDIDKLNLASRLLKVKKHHDYPKMIKPLSEGKMITYYKRQALSFKKDILK